MSTNAPTRPARAARRQSASVRSGRHRHPGGVRAHRLLALGVAWLLGALAAAAPVQAQTATTPSVIPSVERTTLLPGDIVRLQIWREPDLSGDFTVDEKGVVVLPRVGAVPVSEYSLNELERYVGESYLAYLNHTSITVVLLRRVQVLGAVRAPGLYHVDATMSISDVLALAGGTTPHGNIKKLRLIRRGQPVPEHISPLTQVGMAAVRSGDQLYVPDKPWIIRNPAIITIAFSAIVSFTLSKFR